MDNKDYIVRASLANDSVRAFAISSTHLVAEARERHRTLPVVTAALGRLPISRSHNGQHDEG